MVLRSQCIYERLENSWREALHDELQEPYIADLCSFLEKEYAPKKKPYPPEPEIFAAFDLTPFDKVKVVLIGQDPYYRHGQAHGLCFSVRDGVKLLPSLKNILKEVKDELRSERKSGDLTGWAMQGVLLLNMALTVEERKPGKQGSHLSKWKCFTETVIKKLAARNNLVFIAWGKEAQKAVAEIVTTKHKVLKSAHPSPRSNSRAPVENRFSGNNHFKEANKYLRRHGREEINWQL
jgi:uracil-DNA glycosylase